MRWFLLSTLALSLALPPAPPARADDAVRAILDKAIKAEGGAEKLDKARASETKMKGTIDAAGMKLDFTHEIQVQMPDKVKSVMQLQVAGQNVTITSVFNGKNLWINANGMNVPTDDKMLAEVREQMYQGEVGRLTVLRDEKKFKLTPLGDVKVDGQDAVGILVASKGHRDISLFFDKKSGLVVKIEHRSLDPMSGQEFTQETLLKNYRDVDGLQEAKNLIVKRDGKDFMVAEVTETKVVDKFDDSTFAKP